MKKNGENKRCAGHSSPADTVPAIVRSDPYLQSYSGKILHRISGCAETEQRLTGGKMSLADFAAGHEYFGLHFRDNEWILREWAPNASKISLIGSFTGWR
ncbi:MAG: 1,4-alpha-glucan-branching enzyme, partial [Kiritimatiellia bacterium]|nr:1,4-alpha-glucan-branching enzyme [Kiritimatiellia bacterium]